MELPLGRSLVFIFVLVSSSIFNGCTGVKLTGNPSSISEATNSVSATGQPALTASSVSASSTPNPVPNSSGTTTATVVASDLIGSDTPSLNSDAQSASLKVDSSQTDALSAMSTTNVSGSASTSKRFDRIKVSISPGAISLSGGATQQFTASVSGTKNTGVTWTASAGSVSPSGLYAAPSLAGTYIVQATSVADPTKSASASVTVSSPVSVVISPVSASMQTGGSQQFTASVTGATNASVTWSATGGSISASGLYTAPATAGTYTVTARSVADTSKLASANVSVTAPPPPVSITITPTSTSLIAGDTRQFTATVTNSNDTSVTWTTTAGTISPSGLYTAPATTGTYTVTAKSVADTTKTASAAVTVTAPTPVTISVSPTSSSLTAGGKQQFTATVGGSSDTSVTWSATGGTVSTTGLYTAPATTGTYTVTAKSAADTTKSASAIVTVSVTQLLSVSPTSIAFGSVLTTNTATQTITLSNTGSGPVTLSAANFTGGVFSATGLALPVTIAAGATKAVTITFAPSISGPFSGSVSFVSNATNSPGTVSLSGSGVAPQSHAVDLTWIGSTSSGVMGYYVYRSTVSGIGYAKLNPASAAPTTTYTDSTVQSGVTYYYVVTAVDSAGNESSFSNQSMAGIPVP
jgi:hypothetical protein